jgi:hypothetical protein
MLIKPLFPLLEEPELNTNDPLLPLTPAFMLRIVIVPLLEAVPSPLDTLNNPPDAVVLRPDSTCTLPPAPQVPLPTVTITIPPRPSVATPEPKAKAPLFPPLEDPVLNTSAPLPPVAPAFMVRMVTVPLLLAVPSPEDRLSAPPV